MAANELSERNNVLMCLSKVDLCVLQRVRRYRGDQSGRLETGKGRKLCRDVTSPVFVRPFFLCDFDCSLGDFPRGGIYYQIFMPTGNFMTRS